MSVQVHVQRCFSLAPCLLQECIYKAGTARIERDFHSFSGGTAAARGPVSRERRSEVVSYTVV